MGESAAPVGASHPRHRTHRGAARPGRPRRRGSRNIDAGLRRRADRHPADRRRAHRRPGHRGNTRTSRHPRRRSGRGCRASHEPLGRVELGAARDGRGPAPGAGQRSLPGRGHTRPAGRGARRRDEHGRDADDRTGRDHPPARQSRLGADAHTSACVRRQAEHDRAPRRARDVDGPGAREGDDGGQRDDPRSRDQLEPTLRGAPDDPSGAGGGGTPGTDSDDDGDSGSDPDAHPEPHGLRSDVERARSTGRADPRHVPAVPDAQGIPTTRRRGRRAAHARPRSRARQRDGHGAQGGLGSRRRPREPDRADPRHDPGRGRDLGRRPGDPRTRGRIRDPGRRG